MCTRSLDPTTELDEFPSMVESRGDPTREGHYYEEQASFDIGAIKTVTCGI